MRINSKKTVIILLFTGVIIVIGFFLLQRWTENYVKDFLKQKPSSLFSVKYSDLDISLLQGNVILYNSSIKIKDTTTSKNHTYLKLEKLQLKGIGYWDLVFNKTLTLRNLSLINPQINYYPYKRIKSKKAEEKALIKL